MLVEPPWNGTDANYNVDNPEASDPVNQALSAANTALYGAVHSVVVALGCSPGLGFVHTGTDQSFVYDIADLYKADTTIPIAFDIAAAGSADLPADTRRLMRDVIYEQRLMEQCVKDVRNLLSMGDPDQLGREWESVNMLWNGTSTISGGTNYGTNEEPDT